MDTRAAIVVEIPRLRRYARVLLGDATAADDLVQDCLERALGRVHLFHAGTNLRAWLFTIMHNLHVNARVRASRSPEIPVDPAALGGETEPVQGSGLLLRDLDRALAQLPDDQRAALLLVGLEGLSYRETADVLGVPVGTVMSRLARGRERLRRLIDGGSRQALRQVK
jgi:RNA polymerase sigma-70 factor (ECF subfamily)